jgi:hypothetical protein
MRPLTILDLESTLEEIDILRINQMLLGIPESTSDLIIYQLMPYVVFMALLTNTMRYY